MSGRRARVAGSAWIAIAAAAVAASAAGGEARGMDVGAGDLGRRDVGGPVEQGARVGGAELRMGVSAEELTVADRLRVTLRLWVSAEEARERWVEGPAWPEALLEVEGLRVVDVEDRGPVAEETGGFVFTRTVTYEPFLPGTRVIPAVRLEGRAGLEVPAVRVEVRALVEGAPADAESLARALGVGVSLAEAPTREPVGAWVWVMLGAGSAMLAGPLVAMGAAAVLRRREARVAQPMERLRGLMDGVAGAGLDVGSRAGARVLDDVHAALMGVMAEEFGPRAASWSAEELAGWVVRGGGPGDWPEGLGRAVVAAAKGLEDARFDGDAGAQRSAWERTRGALGSVVSGLEGVRRARVHRAETGRAETGRAGASASAGRAA